MTPVTWGRCLGALALTAIAACSQLFDEPVQCNTDFDCQHFGGVCNVVDHVCAAAPAPDAGPKAQSPVDAGAVDASAPPDPCLAATKPSAVVGDGNAVVTGSATLGCDKDWTLSQRVLVHPGAVLTIEAGTTIRGTAAAAAIVVQPGGKIVAQGTAKKPIVLTSGAAKPGVNDWTGLILLGHAPPATQTPIGGDANLAFGGPDANDASGVLAFVRLEYTRLGLYLAGVGNGTSIDSVEVFRAGDDCFHLSGGTVSVKHLFCQHPGDEQFQFDAGYVGRAQFLFGQKSAPPQKIDANGVLLDAAHPVIYNATLAGDAPSAGFGIVSRNNAMVDVTNSIVTGWTTGVDTVGPQTAPGAIRHSIFFADTVEPAYVETSATTDTSSPTYDDDGGFDEISWFDAAGRANATTDPKLLAPFDAAAPRPWPGAALETAAMAPPNDGFFDPAAKYVGAFRDPTDAWLSGAWVRVEGP